MQRRSQSQCGGRAQFACELLHQPHLSVCRPHTKITKVPHSSVSHILAIPVVSVSAVPSLTQSLLSQSHWAVGASVPGIPCSHGLLDTSSAGELPLHCHHPYIYSTYIYGGPLCPGRSTSCWGAIVSNGAYFLVGGNGYSLINHTVNVKF